MSDDITTVLLHGAGTGAWVWADVADAIGVRAVALEVPGRVAGATPVGCAAALVDEMDRRGIDGVVLVVHSLAGVLVPGLAARLGTRLKHCVYVAAAVPPPGGAFVDALGPVQRAILRLLFACKPGGLKPSAGMIRRELCGDLDAPRADEVVARYEAEFSGLYLTPAGPAPNLRSTTYIKLSEDRSLPPRQQDAMIARLERPRVRMLEAGHLAMLSAPEALAGLLRDELEVARQRTEPNAPRAARRSPERHRRPPDADRDVRR